MARKSILLLSVLLLAVTVLYAQRVKDPGGKKAAKITGFIVDVHCATGLDARDKEHPVSCSLAPKCVESGFAVVSKDTVYKLDENGNKLALELLKETKTKTRMAVTVIGTLNENVLNVDSISEVR